MLRIVHNAGFFSCCSVRLYDIIQYYNYFTTLPLSIDSSLQYTLYKKNKYQDITFDFFEYYHERDGAPYYTIPHITHDIYQDQNYKDIPYSRILPYIKKYFEPSSIIKQLSKQLLQQYHIRPDHCIAVYYRGTDKNGEIKTDTYERFYHKLQEVRVKDPTVQILLQTDETQFVEYMKEKCMDHLIIINELSTSITKKGIHHEKSPSENYNDITYLFSVIRIMSTCNYIICSSGNVSVWMMLYRGHANGVHQNLFCTWV
jgi:hypothetical protein